jgi:RNA polymerase sigma-70 factor (ECF subfamily)
MFDEVGDEALLRRFLNGEEEMFETLAKRYAEPLLGFFFRRTGNLHASEDLLQETLIRIYQKGRSFRGEGSLRSWVYTMALNLARSRGRSRARIPVSNARGEDASGPMESISNGRPDPGESAGLAELGDTIRAAVHSLPEMQQEVFILRHYQNLPFAEIAGALNISPGASRAHMHRALAGLREKLGFLRL